MLFLQPWQSIDLVIGKLGDKSLGPSSGFLDRAFQFGILCKLNERIVITLDQSSEQRRKCGQQWHTVCCLGVQPSRLLDSEVDSAQTSGILKTADPEIQNEQ